MAQTIPAMASVAELVAEARRLTMKPSTPNDALLVEYLEAQEIETADDFLSLSDEAFASITRHTSVTLKMADAMRRLRRDQAAAHGVTIPTPTASEPKPQRSQTTPIIAPDVPVEPLCRVCINEFIGTITMTHNRKRNALGAKLCSEIATGERHPDR